jgi:hypothetical protein
MPSLNERLLWLVVIAAVISLVVWLNLPKLLWPAFIVTLVVLAVQREWRRRQKLPRGPSSN